MNLIRNLGCNTFECRLARKWQVGRMFLAGDAAHTNPPYLGQGACSGMRDTSNLVWKFDLVLRGQTDEALLETYERERLPHVRQLMQDARCLGLMANTANPVKAAVRDILFRFKLTPKPKFPILTAGVLVRGVRGKVIREAGALTEQGRLKVGERTTRYDAHVGQFALVSRTSVDDVNADALLLRPDLSCMAMPGATNLRHCLWNSSSN